MASTVDPNAAAQIVLTLRGRTQTIDCRPGEVIVEAAWRAGIQPPISCLQGACGTCIARVTRGSVAMRHNEVLSADEVAEGYVLTCQSVPTTPEVEVDYEG